jgi:hypothetical protein
MMYRIGLLLMVLSFVLSPRPVAAGISWVRQFQEGASPHAISAALPEKTADRVLGQVAFDIDDSGTSATSLWLPAGVAIAPPSAPNAGRLFIVEYGDLEIGNHRVLSWPSAESFTNGQAADLVIGQADFNTRGGGLDYNRFYGSEAAVVDAAGNLWVADTENNRVLRFDYPLSNGMNASVVLGQPDFNTSNLPNQGGAAPTANTLYYPRGLALDPAGSLWVADDNNNRVLGFGAPFTSNMNASVVIGQASYTSGDPNGGGNASEYTLHRPKGLAMDAAGNLYVAEYENNRVTRFSSPLYSIMPASNVYGQENFTSTDANRGNPTPHDYTLSHPVDVAVSAAGDALYVTDQWNVRVLGFSNPLADALGSAVADQVYGQPDYESTTPNNGGVSSTSINEEPLGVAVDAFGDLYHADFRNNRLLAYDAPTQVVGDGTSGSCTEAALDAALANVGRIVFSCGTAQIDLSSTKVIAAGTIIDGGGAITLNGGGDKRLFIVNNGASLILRNITLTNGYFDGDGGAIYNGGSLALENSTIRDSAATLSGGAIVSYGALTITDSLLEGNQALNGGALYPRWGGAQTTIVNSVLRDNHATDTTDGWGGAILAWDGAQVTIVGSDIYSNTANKGGGIYNFANSYLYLEEVTLRDNVATASGGGVYNASEVDMAGITLIGNSAGYSGGALMNNSNAFLINSTLSANSAVGYGGGLENFGYVSLNNVTLSGNSAESGGAIHNFDALSEVWLTNSIVANSPIGGNCDGASLTRDNSDLYSISSDDTCSLAGTGSQNSVDPLLTELGDYGGPTQVHMLKQSSPAIDAASGLYAYPTDQRGVSRPQGSGYDIGAVEVTESDHVKKVYLPMAIK